MCWAQMLSDPEIIDRLEQEMRKGGSAQLSNMRPPLFGFDPHASNLLLLTNQVVAMRIENGSTRADVIEGPIFPNEVANRRLKDFAASKRIDAVARAQARWSQQHEPVMRNA